MKARISTLIATNENRIWSELQKTASLMYVAAPVLIFKPRDGESLPEKWIAGRRYALRIYGLGIIPLGKHDIVVQKIDSVRKEMVTNESGLLAKTWNHLLRVDKADDHTVKYTDEIEIRAGILTAGIWLFAHIFYRHRQRKWKILLGSRPRSA